MLKRWARKTDKVDICGFRTKNFQLTSKYSKLNVEFGWDPFESEICFSDEEPELRVITFGFGKSHRQAVQDGIKNARKMKSLLNKLLK